MKLISLFNMDTLDNLSTLTNRSKAQTIFLFDLCNKNLERLILLEATIKKKHIAYCPSTEQEIKIILEEINGN